MANQIETDGQYLQRERERQNISLVSVARETKIGLPYLQALEKNELHLFLPEVFIRGYLRSYAKAIHLDPQEIPTVYFQPLVHQECPKVISKSRLTALANSITAFLGFSPVSLMGKSNPGT